MEREKYGEVTNPTVFSKWYRQRLSRLLGKCPYCPWHGGENYSASRYRIRKGWKWRRKYKWRNIPTVS